MKRKRQKNKRIVLGVSACLLGEKTRYDGDHKRHDIVVNQLAKRYELLPVCPEVIAGLGVPRPPVQLVDTGGHIKALGVDDTSLDVTRLLACERMGLNVALARVSGFVLKSRSPSCGYGSTPIHSERCEPVGIGDGLFVRFLIQRQPLLPMIEEWQLNDVKRYEAFIHRVEAYRFSVECPLKGTDSGDL